MNDNYVAPEMEVFDAVASVVTTSIGGDELPPAPEV